MLAGERRLAGATSGLYKDATKLQPTGQHDSLGAQKPPGLVFFLQKAVQAAA
jgi:hypothetical protein